MYEKLLLLPDTSFCLTHVGNHVTTVSGVLELEQGLLVPRTSGASFSATPPWGLLGL